MTFSIKAIIRAFVAPQHRLNCSPKIWQQVVGELERRGERRHESGVFLLGVERGARRDVREAIFYDDLDRQAYATGICVLRGDAFAKLWAICRAKNLTVVADAHTHPGLAVQSSSDRTNPMIARPGHIAIIIPGFARCPIRAGDVAIYEYCGQHEWIDRNSITAPGYFYSGVWS
jgi:hypothetical protein